MADTDIENIEEKLNKMMELNDKLNPNADVTTNPVMNAAGVSSNANHPQPLTNTIETQSQSASPTASDDNDNLLEKMKDMPQSLVEVARKNMAK